ncbi:hypothetical protein [Tamlana sp. I1]|uniref:hypothetical protein n=1 Tax=Tamlana sp. I1 TaxID=2762061 RepID=UPI00188F1747|nr:hypothetical protein [Tamlana sp. I1]
MKKIVLSTLVLAFSTFALSAQSFPVKTSDLTESASNLSSGQEKQIKNALMNDKDLQSKTIDFLKSDPETSKSVLDLATKSSSNSDLMSSILGNKSLAAHAIDYITKNPKLLKQALKFVGM